MTKPPPTYVDMGLPLLVKHNPCLMKEPPQAIAYGGSKNGDYLLSHLRSTIGVGGLNFSVRNGKRWDPDAIVT